MKPKIECNRFCGYQIKHIWFIYLMAIYFIGLIMPVVKVAGESSKPRDGSKTCKTAGLLTYVSSFCGHQVLKGY